jgi:aerobic carbon-monoxide dehydrogenase medium subunit
MGLPMKPASFRYFAPASVEEALALKAEHGDEARFLAGGQSLVPAMNFRLAQPAVLIDLNPLADLAGVRRDGTAIVVGAMTRYRTLQRDPMVAAHQPLIVETLPLVAHPQIRNRGTIGGNLAHADPASELPALMLALGARIEARSTRGGRSIAAVAFFTGALSTVLAPDELLASIVIPDLPARTGTCFLEASRRRGDFAMMGVAAVVTLAEDGRCAEARLAFCGAGDRPLLAVDAAAALAGRPHSAIS